MATNYPGSLDSYATLVDNVDSVAAADMNNRADAIEALEAKIGVDSSAVNTSLDYFLKHASGAYRTHTHDGTSDDGANIPSASITGQIASAKGGTGADLSAVAQGAIPYFSATGVMAGLAAGTSGYVLMAKGAGANPEFAAITGNFIAVIDGGGEVITTGKKLTFEVPFACTLTRYTMTADLSGSIVIDVNRSTYANYDTTASIAGSGKEPTISSAKKGQDTDISDWTDVTLDAGDILEFEVDSCTTITRCTLSLRYTRTA